MKEHCTYKEICKHNTEIARRMQTEAFELLKHVQSGQIDNMIAAAWACAMAQKLQDYAQELKWMG